MRPTYTLTYGLPRAFHLSASLRLSFRIEGREVADGTGTVTNRGKYVMNRSFICAKKDYLVYELVILSKKSCTELDL